MQVAMSYNLLKPPDPALYCFTNPGSESLLSSVSFMLLLTKITFDFYRMYVSTVYTICF